MLLTQHFLTETSNEADSEFFKPAGPGLGLWVLVRSSLTQLSCFNSFLIFEHLEVSDEVSAGPLVWTGNILLVSCQEVRFWVPVRVVDHVSAALQKTGND